MRIVNRLLSGTALLALPYFSTAQVTKATDDYAHTHVNAAPITIRRYACSAVVDQRNVVNFQAVPYYHVVIVENANCDRGSIDKRLRVVIGGLRHLGGREIRQC